MQVIHPECFLIYPFLFQNYFKVQLWLPFPAPSYQIERAMAEIFTPATQTPQPLSHSEWLSGCSSHSGRVAAPATLAAWLSGWVAPPAALAEWLSGWVAAPATLGEWLSGWVAPPATLPEWLSGCSSHCVADGLSGWGLAAPATLAEWLLQLLWQSGWVAAPATLAEWLLQPLWQSGWVAEWLRQSHQPMNLIKFLNISMSKQGYMIVTATWFTNITL